MNDYWITGGDNQKIGIITRWQKRESRSLGMSPVLLNSLFSLLVIIPVFEQSSYFYGFHFSPCTKESKSLQAQAVSDIL